MNENRKSESLSFKRQMDPSIRALNEIGNWRVLTIREVRRWLAAMKIYRRSRISW